MNQILKRQTSPFHYGSKFPAVTITVFKLSVVYYLLFIIILIIVYSCSSIFLHMDSRNLTFVNLFALVGKRASVKLFRCCVKIFQKMYANDKLLCIHKFNSEWNVSHITLNYHYMKNKYKIVTTIPLALSTINIFKHD